MMQHLPVLAIAIPLLAAFLMPFLGRISRHVRNILAVLVAAANAAICVALGVMVYAKGPLTYVLGGEKTALTMPSGNAIPIRIMLELDGFSVLLAISCSIVAVAAMVYSISFMK
jgi:multicomponent Na+:H+ antiporter subunit D